MKDLRFQMGRHSLTSWFMICHIHFTFLHLSVEVELKQSFSTVENNDQA